jgi:hypothetical protein
MANRMNLKNCMLISVFLLTMFFCSVADAMRLDANSIAEITTAPNHQIRWYERSFALSDSVAVWIDDRETFMSAIYGVNLDDPNYREFVVDPNATTCNQLAMSGPLVVYNTLELFAQHLSVTDITDQNNPFTVPLLIPYVRLFDVSGSVIAYSGYDPNNEWRDTIYAADISGNIRQHSISALGVNQAMVGLTIDANLVTSSVENYDGNDFVLVADITNPNEPNVLTAELPMGITFEGIDTSGQWLVTQARQDWQYRIFAVHNYRDVNNWNIQLLWKEGENDEYYVSGPRIDGPIMVWLVTTSMPADAGQLTSADSSEEFRLKAAYLLGNGKFTRSTLRVTNNWMEAADIRDLQVVWSGEDEPMIMDLFKGSILLECGDWGYKLGDLNLDCVVDFRDFAFFADDWLECTTPCDENCEPG